MATKRVLSALLALYTDNVDGDISGADSQDFVASAIGSRQYNSVAVNTVLTTDFEVVYVDATSGTITITLPTAVGNTNKIYLIAKLDTTANPVLIAPNGSQTISGNTRSHLYYPKQSLLIVSDGANWEILDSTPSVLKALFAATATGTVANTAAQTTLLSTGLGAKTVLANGFRAGSLLKFKGIGLIGATGTPDLTIRSKVGAISLASVTTTLAAISAKYFEIEYEIFVRSIGATGSFVCNGRIIIDNVIIPLVSAGPTAIDTTANETLDTSAQWTVADAANTVALSTASYLWTN